jgi:hypothetical protein
MSCYKKICIYHNRKKAQKYLLISYQLLLVCAIHDFGDKFSLFDVFQAGFIHPEKHQ